MISIKSAHRYAKALLDLCLEQGKTDAVATDLLRFTALMNDSNDFRLFLNSPVIHDDKKIAIYDQVLVGYNELTLAFFRLVTKNGREAWLPEIAKQFQKLWEKQRNLVSGTITSAKALDETTKNAILAKVAPSFDGSLSLDEQVDSYLIGGFIIRIEDKQIDASIATQLKSLKQQLVK